MHCQSDPDCGVAFSALRTCAFFLLAQKKGTKKKGARVSGGCAVPSPLAVRRAAHELVLRTRTACAASPPPWLHGSAAPDGELPPAPDGYGYGSRRGTACRACFFVIPAKFPPTREWQGIQSPAGTMAETWTWERRRPACPWGGEDQGCIDREQAARLFPRGVSGARW